MAKYKFKLKEAPAPNLAKQGGYKVGDVTYSKDGDTRYTVDAVNPESGKVSWKVTNLPNFDKLFDDINDAAATAKGVYTKVKDDQKFRGFYEDIRQIRNKIRTHLRTEYPEDYKRMTLNEVEEKDNTVPEAALILPRGKEVILQAEEQDYKRGLLVTLEESGGYKIKYWYGDNVKVYPAEVEVDGESIKKDAIEVDILFHPELKEGHHEDKEVEEMSMSGGAGAYLTPYAFKPTKKKKKVKMGMPSGMVSSLGEEKDPGATLGPGPAASEDGVKDNAYVKQFKYKLVPKNKNGNYVQKGSGLEVKKLF